MSASDWRENNQKNSIFEKSNQQKPTRGIKG